MGLIKIRLRVTITFNDKFTQSMMEYAKQLGAQ